MAARNTTLTLTQDDWTQLTDNDVTAITFQNLGPGDILVKSTTDTTKPTDFTGAIRYASGQGERNATLADLFPGLTGRDRVWAFSTAPTPVFVSHLA